MVLLVKLLKIHSSVNHNPPLLIYHFDISNILCHLISVFIPLPGYSILLFINIFVALGYFAADDAENRTTSGSGSTFVVSILYFAIMPAASFLCWFRPVYKAFRFVPKVIIDIQILCSLFTKK